MRARSGLVLATQTLNPQVLKQFIDLQKTILRPKFPEQKITQKRGRPKVGLFWILAAICIIAKQEGITWRELPVKLSTSQFLIDEGYLRRISHFTTFNRVWNRISKTNLETWISSSGYALSKKDASDLAVDSSGFEKQPGSVWRLAKWDGRVFSKTSNFFLKIHILVTLPSRAVVGIADTKSKTHDAKGFGKVWLKMSKRLPRLIKRLHGDKAYWSENIVGFLTQEGIQAVIPCKKNSIDNGTRSPMDQLIRLQRHHKGIYNKNTRSHLRSEVEHVFGNIKVRKPILRDRKHNNKVKTLLTAFLWYNYKLQLEEVNVC